MLARTRYFTERLIFSNDLNNFNFNFSLRKAQIFGESSDVKFPCSIPCCTVFYSYYTYARGDVDADQTVN